MKLQTFRRKTYEQKYWWAWSDTCCINKGDKEVHARSLRSMYTWYSRSSLTIVHLRDVDLPLEIDPSTWDQVWDYLLESFKDCRWNHRAWTLQEYVASGVIHFYTKDWKPYLPIMDHHSGQDANLTNHKNHFAIQRGMELATGLSARDLKPEHMHVRQKLRLASNRTAKFKEDIAYSLQGIFGIHVPWEYGHDVEPHTLGRLLEMLLNKSSDPSILAWTGGEPSAYNTCLPSEIAVYRDVDPFFDVDPPPALTEATRMLTAPGDLSPVELYKRLDELGPPVLNNGRLTLPCIYFLLPPRALDHISSGHVITVPPHGEVESGTKVELSGEKKQLVVFPWYHWFRDLPDLGNSNDSALRLLTSLRQGFRPLLLEGRFRYKRIAHEKRIVVRIREDISVQQLLENTDKLYVN